MSGHEVLTRPRSFAVVVTDPHGATYGYGGEWVPITTRVLFERGQAFGHENLQQKVVTAERQEFIRRIATEPRGTFGRFTWERE